MDRVEVENTYNIKEVEVFSAGTWNKDQYKVEDLHAMVTAFHTLKDGFAPFLKLGHDDSQKLAKSSGMPAVGWVENLYVKGEKLFADLSYIPKEIFKLIKNKAYRKVSCEIYWDLDVNGVTYPRVLGAIALLGAETPGVMNLADILGNYSLLTNNMVKVFEANQKEDSLKKYDIELETNMEDEMSEEIEKVKEDLEAQKKSYAKAQEDLDSKSKELADAQEKLKSYQLAAEKAQAAEKEAKVAKFVTELEAKKLSTPAMKDLVTELLSDKKEYSVKDKTMTREEVLTEILTLSKEAAKVNFDESSRADFVKKEDKLKELEAKIEKYSKDNKVSYAQAYKAVMKGEKMDEMDEEK